MASRQLQQQQGQQGQGHGQVQAQVIACGAYHTAAINRAGKVVCWGVNASGQCNVPESLEKAVSVCCGAGYTVAITHDSRVVCWGYNGDGQCSVPDGLENVVAVSGGRDHTAALTREGKVICWGSNDRTKWVSVHNHKAPLLNVFSLTLVLGNVQILPDEKLRPCTMMPRLPPNQFCP
jgi:alpha-tubulin suppressor-like RCC1 family protein